MKRILCFARAALAALLVVLCAAWGPAAAQTQDVLGVWFDTSGSLHETTTSTSNQQVTAYLLLLNASEPSGVAGWECTVDVLASQETAYSWVLAGNNSLNITTPPEFVVGMYTPMPWSEAILLATCTLFVPDPTTEVEIYVHPMNIPSIPGPPYTPVYAAGDDPSHLLPMFWPTDCEMRPVATINDDPQHSLVWADPEPTVLNFGRVEVGTTTQRTLLLPNSAPTTMVGSAQITGEGYTIRLGSAEPTTALDFRVVYTETALHLTVRITPPAPGYYAGEVVLSACGEPFATVPCTADAGQAVCRFDPPELDFDYVLPGEHRDLSFIICNVGTTYFSGRIPYDTNPPWFFPEYSAPYDFLLAPGESLRVVARFAPQEYCGYTRWETFAIPDCSPLVLTGNGGSGGTPGYVCCEVEPDTLDFGEVLLGLSAERSFTISSPGGTLVGNLAGGCGDFQVVGGGGPFTVVTTASWTVRFAPTEVGATDCVLPIEGICNDLVCRGVGVEPVHDCTLQPDLLDFGEIVVGETLVRSFDILNTGEGAISGFVSEDCEDFEVAGGGGAFELSPGEGHHVVVRFAPTVEGPDSCEITLGTEICAPMSCYGIGLPPLPSDDVIGIYFDPAGESNELQTYEDMEEVLAYLLILNPTCEAGIAGWECCVVIVGDALEPTWELMGQALNADEVPCFAVDLGGVPLPWSPAVILASVHFLQPATNMVTQFYIHPGSNPAIPGSPTYVDPLDPDHVIPLNISSGSEDVPVALAYPNYIVAVSAGPLTARVEGAGVFLSWEYEEEALLEGFHVYRRVGDGEARRLTAVPLRGWQGRVDYQDPAAGFPEGTVLRYHYAIVAGGAEVGRSDEVAVTVTSGAPAVTVLHAAYPNPFNPATHLRFEVARAGRVQLEVYDLAGRRVRTLFDGWLPAVVHEEIWDGRDDGGRPVPSGVYYCRLLTADRTAMQKLTLLK